MGDGFRGIDIAGLGGVAATLDRISDDVSAESARAYAALSRHSRWAAADSAGTRMSTISRWSELEASELRRRAAAMLAAQSVVYNPFGIGGPVASGPWIHHVGSGTPLPWLDLHGQWFDEAEIPWEEIENWVSGALGIWNGRRDATFPTGRWVGGLLYSNRTLSYLRGAGPIPTVANGWVMRRLANTSALRWINNPAVQTAGRRFSIVLSAYSTYQDGAVVWNHGNPIDAFEEHGAGYVADVARLGFSASTTAFLVAPNPITGGAVIVTGVVWAGAEVVDHWDEISAFAGEQWTNVEDAAIWVYDGAGDVIEQSWDWSSDRWDQFEGWTESRLDDLSRGADTAVDWGQDRLEDIGDGLDSARDAVGELAGSAKDKIGDGFGAVGGALGGLFD